MIIDAELSLPKRGRPKGSPRVLNSGRKKGVPNKLTTDLKELILKRGKPVELLADVARGVKIRIGPQAGPGEPTYVYPTLEQRMEAAKLLLAKVVPNPSELALTGKDGGPIETAHYELSDIEPARRVAFLFNKTGLEPGGSESEARK